MGLLSDEGCHPEDGLSVQIHAHVHSKGSTVQQTVYQAGLWLVHMSRGPKLLPGNSNLAQRRLHTLQKFSEAGLAPVHEFIQVNMYHPCGKVVEGLEEDIVAISHADGWAVILADIHHEGHQAPVDVWFQHAVRPVTAAIIYEEEVLHALSNVVVQLQKYNAISNNLKMSFRISLLAVLCASFSIPIKSLNTGCRLYEEPALKVCTKLSTLEAMQGHSDYAFPLCICSLNKSGLQEGKCIQPLHLHFRVCGISARA